MRQIDLFAGIGGISLAAEWADIETVAFCEKEPFAQNVLRRRFPGRPIYDDVFNLTREVLEADGIIGSEEGIDIVAGGFPCQPFSNAGKRTGTSDDRYLWPEMCRIIGELRPTWVFAENVDGLVSMAQSGGSIVMEDETTICDEAEMVIETIRKDLEAIGYRSIPAIIPACGIGAVHRRYRIFVVGYADSFQLQGEQLLRIRALERRSAPGQRERTSDGTGQQRTAQSGMGGSPYELSDWLDGWGMNPLDALINFIAPYPQPALMGQEQYAWEPPRVAMGVKNRTSRLKALGNAVDPLQALPVLYGIRVIDEYLRGESNGL